MAPASYRFGLDGAARSLTLALSLALLLVALRVLGTQWPGLTGNRIWAIFLPLGFVIMAAVPFVFLTTVGRAQIGMTWPTRKRHLLHAACAGAALALCCFGIGLALFGPSEDHWFVSIANYYRAQMDTRAFSVWKLHLVFTLPALLFSPIGEELFFRGFLQQALQQRFTVRVSTLIDSGLFALVHLCHHGMTLTQDGIEFRPLSASAWVGLMFFTGLAFAALRQHSGSLLPAVIAHLAFNATMNITIFAALWT